MTKLKTLAQTTGLTVLVVTVLALWMVLPLLLLGVALGLAGWLLLSRSGQQTLAITWTGLSTLPQRLGATSVIVVGIAGVVGVLIALLAMAAGFEATLKQAGSTDTAIVLRAGADAELSSGLDRNTTTLVAQAPGVLRDAQDRPIASAEVVVIANVLQYGQYFFRGHVAGYRRDKVQVFVEKNSGWVA